MSRHPARDVNSCVRRRYGAGWTVTIERTDADGDGQSWFAPVEVERFTIRG